MLRVNNLGFAAYLLLLGRNLLRPPYRDIEGRFVFEVDIEEESGKQKFHEYSSSGYAEFDAKLVMLKKMLRRG